MSVSMRFGFDSSAITRHLHHLELLDANGFDAARREIGEYLIGGIQDNFDKQRLADGSPMPQSKAAIKRKGKTLIEHHHLYDSYVYQLVQRGLEWGSPMVYARIHHDGGNAGRGHKTHIDARPVMGLGPVQERRIGSFLLDAVAKATS